MISRGYAWLDENVEHSDADCARAAALAKKWSALMSEDEDRRFRMQADVESGYDYDPFEDCECNYCLHSNHDCNEDGQDGSCTLCAIVPEHDYCEERRAAEVARQEKQAERDLEIELIEDKLAAIGARMMRPYEHWNEDERYMEYMETRYDNAY
jgi:hypothetical protein